MAEPGDPHTRSEPKPAAAPETDPALLSAHAHDDLIGFTSPSSLAGRPREIAPDLDTARLEQADEDLFGAPAEAAPAPSQADLEPAALPLFGSEDPVFNPAPFPAADHLSVEPERQPRPQPAPAALAEPIPDWAVETPRPPAARPVFGGAAAPAAPPEGAMGLYTIYALTLFAVPTLGVAALIALVAVVGRPAPQQPLALSHHLYQRRTLWIAAIAAALGVVLIAVNLGVFVLFVLAVWVVVRGAMGILKLSAGQPIARPNGWLL